MKSKDEVQREDHIHIYHIFGVENAKQYRDMEGICSFVDTEAIYVDLYNNLGFVEENIRLYFDDDWEIIG